MALPPPDADLHALGDTSLVLMDVDDFKAINDVHGHPAGDAALVHVADVVRSQCRPEDLAFRLGGDELMLLMRNCPQGVASERADRLRALIADRPFSPAPGTTLSLSVSIGVSSTGDEQSTLGELYQRVDRELYRAKLNKPRIPRSRGHRRATTSRRPWIDPLDPGVEDHIPAPAPGGPAPGGVLADSRDGRRG